MSPIFVRPVREQLEHDRLIRHLLAKYKRKNDVAINPGDEQQAPIRVGEALLYPDMVLVEGKKLAGLVEIETGESVNNLEAMYQWVPFSKAKVPFHLYVPVPGYEAARRLIDANQVRVTEIWTYRPTNDGFDLVKLHADPAAVQATKGGKAAVLAPPPPKPVPPPPEPPPPPKPSAPAVPARFSKAAAAARGAKVVAGKAGSERPGVSGKVPAPAPAAPVRPGAKSPVAMPAGRSAAPPVPPAKVAKVVAKPAPAAPAPIKNAVKAPPKPVAKAPVRPVAKPPARPVAKAPVRRAAPPSSKKAKPAAKKKPMGAKKRR